MPSLKSASYLLAAALAVSACSVNPATGDRNFTAFMSPEKELQIGRQEHPKILKQHGGTFEHARLTNYVNRIGQSLAAFSETPDLKFTFTVLNDELINAFALPGGFVYITRGLLSLAENEAEVAGVLAHEIGHVVGRHTAQRYSQGMATKIGVTVFDILLGGPGISQAAGFGAQAYMQSFSRGHEMEADMLAVRYLSKAGYAPSAMESFFHKMAGHSSLQAKLEGKDGNEAFNIMQTHPRTSDRIQQAIKLAKMAKVVNPRVARNEYLAAIDGMLFGDDPKQGIRKGRTFIHPELGFQFKVPPGYYMFNSPQKIVARGPGGAVMVFDGDSKTDPLKADMARYVRDVWASDLSLIRLQPLAFNGLEGATASSRKGNNDLRLVAVKHPKGIYRFLFITPKNLTPQLDEEQRRTAYSFRTLTQAEKDKVRPLRIKTVIVRKNETPQSIAKWLPFEARKDEWFQLLNRNLSNRPLKPGDRVKVVAQ